MLVLYSDPAQPAVHHLRVIEIPTPGWTACDARYSGVEPYKDAVMALQKRTYKSPILYAP